MLKIPRILKTTALAVGLLGLTAAAAVAAPVLTNATYDLATGVLTLTGTGIEQVTGAANDINLAKVAITDSLNHSYTLSSKAERTNTSSAAITLKAKEQEELAKFLDQNSAVNLSKALNTGVYQVDVFAGWNGSNSLTDLTAHALTVSNVTALTSATYDFSTGILALTGTSFAAVPGASNDILPKFLTITNGKDKYYTLTTSGVERASATLANITLNAKDKVGLEGVFNRTGNNTADDDTSGSAFNIIANYGWNGKNALASVGTHTVTVSGYVAPTVTLSQDKTVVYKQNLLLPVGTFNKAGTVYAVPFATTTTSSIDLDSLVAGKTALKATVADKNRAVTIPVSERTLTLGSDTEDFKLIAFDKAGVASTYTSNKITVNNISAPSLTVTVAPGTVSGTKVTATVASGNSLAYWVTSGSAISIPKVGYDVTSNSGIQYPYTSGTDITTVDATTNKYLGIYEINTLTHEVVKFKGLNLSATQIKTLGTATVGNVNVSGTTGSALSMSYDVIVTIANDKIKTAIAADADIASWITNLPTGLTAKAKSAVAVNATVVTIKVEGTPTATLSAPMAITIPAANLIKNASVTATSNDNAKFTVTATATP